MGLQKLKNAFIKSYNSHTSQKLVTRGLLTLFNIFKKLMKVLIIEIMRILSSFSKC